MLRITKFNEVYCYIDGDAEELEAIYNKLSFEIPGAAFHPLVQRGAWDGYIRLLPLTTQKFYTGLVQTVIDFCHASGIEVDTDMDLGCADPITAEDIEQFVATLKTKFAPHDFQASAAADIVNKRRGIWLVPTSGGKTFLTYIIARYTGLRTLVVVPTTTLVSQLVKDFKAYGYGEEVYQIMEGRSTDTTEMVTVSTWHSIYELPAKWFKQFDMIVGDEVHGFKSKSLVQMMEKTTGIKYKIGLTGSLSGSKTHEMVLTGLFGPVNLVTTTRELMNRGIVSTMSIKVIKFQHGNPLPMKHSYADEDAYILACERRNQFIVNLVGSLEGNTLILFRKVERHGDILHKMLTQQLDKDVHYIHGKVKTAKRDEIIAYLEKNTNQIAIASDGTFATGTSVNNIQNVIRVNPNKAVIGNVQGIGRGLRLDGKTNHVTYFDLSDFIGLETKYRHEGYLVTHYRERIALYKDQKFDFKVYNIDLRE